MDPVTNEPVSYLRISSYSRTCWLLVGISSYANLSNRVMYPLFVLLVYCLFGHNIVCFIDH